MDSGRCLHTVDFLIREKQYFWWSAADGWNAAVWRIAWPTRSILGHHPNLFIRNSQSKEIGEQSNIPWHSQEELLQVRYGPRGRLVRGQKQAN
jgi:hypothetical protein